MNGNHFCLESHIHLCSRHTSANPAYVIKTCLIWHAFSEARYSWGFVSPKLHVSTYFSLSGRVRHYWQPRLRGTAHMTIARQLSLLCVCSSKSSIVSSGLLKLRLMSISFRSVLMHSIQVLVGRPGGLRTGLRNSVIACLAGVSGCSLMVWPRKLALRL